MSLLIKNGKIVTAEKSFLADILVENGKISQVAPKIEILGVDQIVDAAGKLIMPGGWMHTYIWICQWGIPYHQMTITRERKRQPSEGQQP